MAQMDMYDYDFVRACLADIVSRVEELLPYSGDMFDLGMDITSSENANGSWYGNTYSAIDDIRQHFELYRLFYLVCDNQELFHYYDMYGDTELWHCCVMISLFSFLFNRILEGVGYDYTTEEIDINLLKNYVTNKVDYNTVSQWFNTDF